ncbi:MAG: GDSL-type esterase/lipase family protein [Erysipelotrichaceae bacterium]|nr:GDSL-type esterase/lipase family protein [Erysipelotrichaceae bacterium]
MSKWVSTWGNAMSYKDVSPAEYAKDITLRYTVLNMFVGQAIRLSFDNFTGTEKVTLSDITVDLNGEFYDVLFDGTNEVTLDAKEQKFSDPLSIDVKQGDILLISYYLKDFTSLKCGVLTTGPYSSAQFAWGNETRNHTFPKKTSKKTNWVHFLNQIDVLTEDDKECIICYGDSITAQDWPDFVQMELFNEHANKAVIRRAVSGTRILREYDCLTYLAYGLKGDNRFDHEMEAASASSVIIFQGINDIIHPVGANVNEYRPWSDLPTLEELIDGLKKYIEKAKALNYKVYLVTLLPIEGWRTYADFREELRVGFNEWIRQSGEAVIDFDKALRDEENIHKFKDIYDSGDHLHPSTLGYKKLAETALEAIR